MVAAVLSGNRNFEGRVNPHVRANYLASPPLCVAYALAGSVDVDLASEPLGTGSDGKPVYLRDVWPSQAEVAELIAVLRPPRSSSSGQYADVFQGSEEWRRIQVPSGGALPLGRGARTLRAGAALLRRPAARAGADPADPRARAASRSSATR